MGRAVARPGPLDEVRARLRSELAPEALASLPEAYFRVGDVLVLSRGLPEPANVVAQAYAEVLGMKSVLLHTDHVDGEFRVPRTVRVWGSEDTRTVHREHGIEYALDPARVMWSPGNLEERRRVATWDARGETVVDFFAGVGYFTIPIAVGATPDRVIAVEKNPQAFAFLQENILRNGVDDRVRALLGDCREIAPEGVADRVVLGYLPDSIDFVPHALAALGDRGGRLHVHRVVGAGASPTSAVAPVLEAAAAAGKQASLEAMVRVKSYAQRRDHVVLDVKVTR